MKRSLRRLAAAIAAATAFALASAPAAGQNDDSLKAAHDRYLAQWMAGDLAAIERAVHADAAGFWADAAAPTDFRGLGGVRRQQALKTLLSRTRNVRITPINIRHRTYRDTGIVWGTYRVESAGGTGAAKTENWRTTEVFTRDSNGWLLVSWHFSDLPSRK